LVPLSAVVLPGSSSATVTRAAQAADPRCSDPEDSAGAPAVLAPLRYREAGELGTSVERMTTGGVDFIPTSKKSF
jgi:hypothetical protein